MDSSKNMIRCTIDFLPDEDEYDVVIAFRAKGDDGWHGCREQRFNTLEDACIWVKETHPDIVTAWSTRQESEVAPVKSEESENSGRPLIFISPWASPKQVRKSLKKAGTTNRNKKGKGG